MPTLCATAKAAALMALTAAPLAAKPAQKEPTPRAFVLLCQAKQAVSSAHPITIGMVLNVLDKGKAPQHISATLVRNDATHFVDKIVAHNGQDDEDMNFYRNGAESVAHFIALNTYQRQTGDKYNPPDISSTISESLNSMAPGMSQRYILRHSHVEETTLDGMRVYRVTLTNLAQKKPDETERIDAIIRRSDKLPLRFLMDTKGGTHAKILFTYQRPKAPYPASTFVFVPPPGAKEAGKDR